MRRIDFKEVVFVDAGPDRSSIFDFSNLIKNMTDTRAAGYSYFYI